MRCFAGRVVVLVGLVMGGSAMWAQAATGPQTLVSIPDVVDEKSFDMSLRKGPCMGTCPVYAITLHGDGMLEFDGGANVMIPDKHISHLSPAIAQAILEEFRKANFTAAESWYSINEDSPVTYIDLRIGGKLKRVGGGPEGEIYKPAADLEALAARWVTGNDDTASTLVGEGWSFSVASPGNLGLYTEALLKHRHSLIEQYLAVGGPIVSLDGMKLSPVCVATAMGDATLVHRMLASAGKMDRDESAARSMPADAKYECLAAAAASGDVSLFNFWLDQGPPRQVPSLDSPGAQNRWDQWVSLRRAGGVRRWDPVVSFVKNGFASDSLPMVRRMLDFRDVSPNDFRGALGPVLRSMDPNAKDGREIKIVRLALGAGAHLETWDLAKAAGYQGPERVAIVRLLLQQHLDEDQLGSLPLSDAVRTGGSGAAETVRLLLDAGADLHKVNFVAGPTVLFDASCLPEPLQKQMDQSLYEEVPGVCAPEVIKPLVKKGLDLNAVDSHGDTALMDFASREPMVRELLANGADPTVMGSEGVNARQIAQKYGCAACVILIDEAVLKWAPGIP